MTKLGTAKNVTVDAEKLLNRKPITFRECRGSQTLFSTI